MKEAWSEYYSQKEIALIQQIELKSLDAFSEICKKLNIEFFLYGGSLLGAVKYKGFVPWDDDFDVAMMRGDYEKLIEFGPALLSEEYELQHPKIHNKTPYPYIKLRRKDTVMVEYIYRNIKMNHGVYFDVYPIDNLSDNDEEIEHDRKRLLKWSRMLQRKQTISLESPVHNIKGIIRQCYAIASHFLLKFVPHKVIVNKMSKIMTANNNTVTKRQGNLFFPRPVNYFNGVFPLIEMEFEGRKLNIPNGYEINLINRYGNITKEPKAENRVGHKPYLLKLNGWE